MSLVLNPAGTGRKRPTKMEVIGPKGLDKPKHYWVKPDRKKYCQVCYSHRERSQGVNHLPRSTIPTINGNAEVLRVIGAVQDVWIVYAVEIRAVGKLYMHRYQYMRAFGLLFNSLLN